MKKYKGLKLTLIILVIILLAIISFGGVFIQKKGQYINILPEYQLARDLNGYRKIVLKVSDEVEETIKYDAEGNVIADTDTETEVARTEEKKVNSEEILTQENYEKVKAVVEKRLSQMNVTDYIIKQSNESGTIILEVPENENTDVIVGQMSSQGKFEIVDNDTNEVLMTNDDIKSVRAGYGRSSNGTVTVFINFEFNKEGTEKFKNITNTYVETTQTEEGQDSQNVNEQQTEETQNAEQAQQTENSQSTDQTGDKQETVTKEIALKLDDYTLLTTYFDNEVTNGILQLSVGSSSNATQEQLQEYLLEASNLASLVDSGKMPVVYVVDQNQFIYSDITSQSIAISISVAIAIVAIGMIYFIIKYKTKGILASISLVGYIALLLIAIRYFNVEVSIAGLIEIALSVIISYFIENSILKQGEITKAVKNALIILIPSLIIAITFTFMEISIGVVLFWGIAIALLYQISITNLMLRD